MMRWGPKTKTKKKYNVPSIIERKRFAINKSINRDENDAVFVIINVMIVCQIVTHFFCCLYLLILSSEFNQSNQIKLIFNTYIDDVNLSIFHLSVNNITIISTIFNSKMMIASKFLFSFYENKNKSNNFFLVLEINMTSSNNNNKEQ